MWLTGGVYDDWARFLDQWALGEAAVTEALPVVQPEALTADTMQRLNARLSRALQTRLDRWNAALSADLVSARDEFGYGRALAQARTGLRSLRALAEHPSLPADVRRLLGESIDRSIRNVQQQIEEHVERQARATGNTRAAESMRRAVRENSLTAVVTESPTAVAPMVFPPLGERPARRVLPT